MKLTKTQKNCITKSLLFEVADKKLLQKNINSFKCLSGFKVTSVTTKEVILLKKLKDGTFHRVSVVFENTGSTFKEIA